MKDRPELVSEDEWEEQDEIASSIIRSCLSDHLLTEIYSEKSAKAIWKKLEAIYQGKTLTNKLFLKRRCLRMAEDSNLADLHLFYLSLLAPTIYSFIHK